MKKTMITAALALTFGVAAVSAQAAMLNAGDKLILTSGGTTSSGAATGTGSWFGMDSSGDGKIQAGEKTAMTAGPVGIVIGSTQAPGQIDSWSFYSAVGKDWTSTAITGGTTAGLNMSGWTVNWNGGDIPMSGGAWTPLNCGAIGCTGYTFANGVGSFSWNGVNGGAFNLWYSATVPSGSFTGVHYVTHLTGTVQTVPVPAAAWLMGSGLLGLVGVARRNKKQA